MAITNAIPTPCNIPYKVNTTGKLLVKKLILKPNILMIQFIAKSNPDAIQLTNVLTKLLNINFFSFLYD